MEQGLVKEELAVARAENKLLNEVPMSVLLLLVLVLVLLLLLRLRRRDRCVEAPVHFTECRTCIKCLRIRTDLSRIAPCGYKLGHAPGESMRDSDDMSCDDLMQLRPRLLNLIEDLNRALTEKLVCGMFKLGDI